MSKFSIRLKILVFLSLVLSSLSSISVSSVTKSACDNRYFLEMTPEIDASMTIRLNGEECSLESMEENTIVCSVNGVYTNTVKLEVLQNAEVILNQNFDVTHADPKVESVSVHKDFDFFRKSFRIKVKFDDKVSCIPLDDFTLTLKSSFGNFDLSDFDGNYFISPTVLLVTLPEADWGVEEKMELEILFKNPDGERKKIYETSLTFSNENERPKQMALKRLRMLAATKLVYVWPNTIFANTNPISLKLTFDDSVVLGDITAVSLIQTGQPSVSMTIGAISNGQLTVTFANTNTIATGTYSFLINNGSITTTGITLTVNPSFIFAWFTNNYTCPGVNLNLVLSFNQNLSANTIASAKISNIGTTYNLVLGSVQNNNQIVVTYDNANGNTVRGTYTISVVDYLGTTHNCATKYDIGYPYILNSVSTLHFGVGATCTISTAFTFDRTVVMTHFKFFKMGSINFTTTTRNSAILSQVDVSVGNQAAGVYAPTAVDQCDRSITNSAGASITVWQLPAITGVDKTCAVEGVSTTVVVTFASALNTNFYTGTSIKETTSLAVTNLAGLLITGSTITHTIQSNSLGTYNFLGNGICSQVATSAATFKITKAPAITSNGHLVFDTTKVTTYFVFDKDISSNDVVSVSLVGTTTYTPTVTYPADNTKRMNIVQTTVNAGTYNLVVTFQCSHTQQKSITVVAVPVLASDTPVCTKQGAAISFTSTFNANVIANLITSGTIYNATPTDSGSLTVTQSSQNNAVFTFSKSDGLTTLGTYTYKINDTSESQIAGLTSFKITEAYTPTINISVWNISSNFSFVATFDKSFISGQIKSFKITKTDDSSVNFSSTSFTENVAAKTITVSYTTAVNVAGLYKVTAIDSCNLSHDFTTNLRITTVPSITSFTPKCVIVSSAFTLNLNFNQNIYSTQFLTNGATLKDGVSLTLGAYGAQTLAVSGTAGSTANDFAVNLTDMANSSVLSTQKLKFVYTMNPTISVSPSIYDNNYDFVMTLTTVETLVTNQMSTASLQVAGGSSISLAITSQGANQVVLETKKLTTNGLYTLTLTDVCGQTYTVNNAIRIVDIPTITDFNTVCYNQNSSITGLLINFDRTVYSGQMKTFRILDSILNQVGTGTIGSIGGDNKSINVSNTAISTLGLYYINLIDVSNVNIPFSSKQLRILPATFTINSYTPTTWDSTVPMTVTITFNQSVQDGQVVSAKFTSPAGANYPITFVSKTGSTWTGTVTIPKTSGSTSVLYTLSLVDFCNRTVTAATQLQLVDIPVANAINPYCYVKNLSQNINLSFDYLANLVDASITQIKSVRLNLAGVFTSLTLATRTGSTQAVTLPSIASPNNYNVVITDLADQNLPTASVIKIRNYSSPPTLDSYDYSIWRTDKAFSWNIVFSRNIDSDEMVTLNLKNSSTNALTAGTMGTIAANKLQVTFATFSAGNYNLVLGDTCGNTITGPLLAITVPPVITSYSVTFFGKNTSTSLFANLNIAYPSAYFASVSAYENNSKVTTNMTLGAADFSAGNKQNFSTPNGGVPMGVYTFTFTDVTGSTTTSNSNILVLDKTTTPVVQVLSPNIFSPGSAISFSIGFDMLLLREQFTSVKMTCADNNLLTLVINGVSSQNLNVSFAGGVMTIGDCSISITHFNGVVISTPLKLTIVNPLKDSTITSFSPTCSVINTAFTFTVNLSKNLIAGIKIASSTLVDTTDSTQVPFTLNSPAIYSPFIGPFADGVSRNGVYKVRLVDNVGTSVTSASTVKILANAPRVLQITPSQVKYDGTTVNFSAFFDVSFLSSDTSSVVLVESTTNKQIPALLSGVVGNEIRVSTINFVPTDLSYTPVFTLCNTKVKGPTFFITSDSVQPVTPVTPTNTTAPVTTCLQYQVRDKVTNTCYSCDSIGQYFLNGECTLKCPDGYSIYNGSICISSCSIYNQVSYLNKCIDQCPSSFGSSSGNCINCSQSGLVLSNGLCVSQCPSGYAPSNGQCQLILNLFGNTQTASCDKNPCNGGTCKVVLSNQISCTCPENRIGLFCETAKADVTTAAVDNIVTQITSSAELNGDLFYKSMSLNNYLSSSMTNLVTPESSNKIYSYTLQSLQNVNSKASLSDSDSNILKLVNLAINFKDKESKIVPTGRLLQTSTQQVASQIQNLISITKQFVTNYISSKPDFSFNSSTLMGDTYVSFHVATSTASSLSDFMSQSLNSNMTVADLSDCLKTTTDLNSPSPAFIISKLDLLPILNEFLNISNFSSGTVFLGLWDYNTRKSVDVSKCKEANSILVKYPLTVQQSSTVSLPLYQNWKKYGVNIYNSNDPVFTSRCSHLGNYLSYDTTLNYRRTQIYQNVTVSCQGANCTFSGFDTQALTVCSCQNAISPSGIYSSFKNLVLPSLTDINLDLANCPHIAFTKTQVYKNAGFWTGLFVLLALIVIFSIQKIVFNHYSSDEKHRESALVTDGIIHKHHYDSPPKVSDRVVTESPINDPNVNQLADEKDIEIEMAKVNAEIKPSNKDLSTSLKHFNTGSVGFFTIFITTLFQVHPILNLVYHSLVLPFGIKVCLFLFNCFMYFSFNAFIFTDSYITMRMNSDQRDNFGYPMKNEFGKIIASIVITVGLNIFLKFLVLPSPSNIEALRKEFNSNEQIKADTAKTKFSDYHEGKSFRYMMAFTLISIFSLFFFYYDFVFCAVYVNASVGWFYSGIWSLIMVWLAFAPFVALVLSALEFFFSFARSHSIYCHWIAARLLF